MQEEAQKKFKEFEFFKNQEWLNYYKNIYPTPSYTLLEKKKKIWFKKNIDQNFDIDFVPSNSTNSTSNNTGTHNCNNQSNNTSNKLKVDKFYNIENILKIIYVILSIISLPIRKINILQLVLGLIISALVLKRQVKFTKFDMYLFMQLTSKPYFIIIFYFVFLFNLGNLSILFQLPVIILLLSGIASYASIADVKLLNKYEKMRVIWAQIRQNNFYFARARCYTEILLFFYLIILLISRKISILLLIIYFFYIKLRNTFAVDFKNTLYHNKLYVLSKTSNEKVKKVINMAFNII